MLHATVYTLCNMLQHVCLALEIQIFKIAGCPWAVELPANPITSDISEEK